MKGNITEKIKSVIEKLREGYHWSDNASTKGAVGIATIIGGICLFSLARYSFLVDGDLGNKLQRLVTQICVWWDEGHCFTKQRILSDAEVTISPWVGYTGVAIIIVLVGIIIFKLSLNKPEK